jgi:two-component system cell cycle response regulator
MALRVLLADESSTIKKVILLALQDYGVDVKSVPVGLDVLSVTKTYKPDIIFADVLLSKKSGYDVSRELKSDPDTQRIPVILMWSGFMELDEARAKSSLADDRLEKPFDADILRGLVRKYVPRTQNNPVSSYLTFPAMPEFDEPPKPPASPRNPNLDSPSINTYGSSDPVDILAIPELEEEEFSQVPLHPQRPDLPSAEENWTQQSIQNFKSPRGSDAFNQVKSGDPDIDKYMIPDGDLGEMRVETDGEFEEVTFNKAPKTPQQKNTPVPSSKPVENISTKPMSATETVLLERVAREEARAVIESICWKLLPEIAERVVREEINKLLKQAEKDI